MKGRDFCIGCGYFGHTKDKCPFSKDSTTSFRKINALSIEKDHSLAHKEVPMEKIKKFWASLLQTKKKVSNITSPQNPTCPPSNNDPLQTTPTRADLSMEITTLPLLHNSSDQFSFPPRTLGMSKLHAKFTYSSTSFKN